MRRTLFYGWIIVAVTALVLLATAGVRAAPGAFLISMQDEPGWSTAALSFAAAVGLLTYGLAGPISGRLMAAFGIRGVTLLSLVVTAAGLILSGFAREIWQVTVFFGFLAGLGSGLVASVLGPTIANRWFIKDRGLVVGVFGASVSAGQLIFFPFLTTLAVTSGWRAGAVVMAGDRPAPDHPGRPLAARRPGRRRRRCRAEPRPGATIAPAPQAGSGRHAPRGPLVRLLVPRDDVLRLRRDVQRPHRPALHQPCRRSRVRGSGRRGSARGDGRVQLRRDDRVGLADRPTRPPQAAADLLHLPRHQPALPAVRPRLDGDHGLQHPVRPRLHRHGPADRRARRGCLRPAERGHRVRLGVRGAPARRGDRGVRGRRGPRERRRLRRRVRGCRLDRDHRRVRGAGDPPSGAVGRAASRRPRHEQAQAHSRSGRRWARRSSASTTRSSARPSRRPSSSSRASRSRRSRPPTVAG